MSESKHSVAPLDSATPRDMGTEPLAEPLGLELALRVAVELAALHAAGRIHRAVHKVTFDRQHRPHPPSPPQVCEFGGSGVDIESCPPELQNGPVVSLPAGIDQAAQVLQKRKTAMSPERVDVYQLGALLCRLTSGKSLSSYLKSPLVKGNISSQLRAIIDAALGYDPSIRQPTMGDLIEAIKAYQTKLGKASDTGRIPPNHGINTDAFPSEAASAGRRDQSANVRSAWTDADLPFQRLAHYEILEHIGHGGMGDVYKAYERSLNRIVAIKVLPASFAREPEFVSRFRAEATAVASITHPNVVQVYFIGEDQGHHFFAMEYVEGESLADLLRRDQRLRVDDALTIIERVLAGLKAAHQREIVHRDIKPGNVLIDRTNHRVLVVDFGLVKSIDASGGMTATGVVMGTADYISPEQGRGHPVDARSDLYSVGIMMYQLLSGQLPFTADSATAMIFQHVYEEPRPLCELVPEVRPPLAAIIAKLISKAPGARQQTAEAVLTDIQAFRRGETPPSLRPASDDELVTDVVVVDEPRRTEIIRAPQFQDDPPLLAEQLAPPQTGWWDRTRDRMLGRFQAAAPQLAERLQNTQQLVHGAVAEYQRRHDQLSGLLREAEEARAELQQQHDDYASAAQSISQQIAGLDTEGSQEQLQKRAECEEQVNELSGLLTVQDEEIESLRLKLSQVRSTLGRLRSQRDSLNARLKLADARLREGTVKSQASSRRRLFVIGSVGLSAIVVTVIISTFVVRRFALPLMANALSARDSKPTTNQGYDPRTNTPNEFATPLNRGEVRYPLPLRQLLGHESIVNSVAFSPKSNLIASASEDFSIRLWDADTGVEINRLGQKSDARPFRVVAFSPSGRLLASGSPSHVPGSFGLTIWDVATGKALRHLSEANAIVTLSFSPDGKTLAALHGWYDNALAWNSDKVPYELSLWDAETGQELGRVDSERLRIATVAFNDSLAFSPDGQLLAFPIADSKVALWDLAKREVRRILDAEVDWSLALAFSADGRALAAGGYTVGHVYDGNYYSQEDLFNRILIWDIETGNRIGVLNTPYPDQVERPDIKSLAFSPWGDALAVAEGKSVKIWDLKSASVRRVLRGHVPYSVDYNRDGTRLVSGGHPDEGRRVSGLGYPYAIVWKVSD